MPDAPASRPDPEELRAFCAGALDPARFAAVDSWLAAQPEAEAERALAAAGVDGAAPPALAGLDLAAPPAGFVSDLPRGRLRPGTPLGEGGMAVVSSAHDRVLERVVAVKVLRPRRPGEALEQFHLREAAFRREAALTAGLEHPAIPPIYDVGRLDGLPAFAMKRLDGRPLQEVVQAGSETLAGLMGILLRVAEAVGYAHGRGVVHRDLSPHNILIADHGAVYVLDWGLAVATGSGDGVRAGTPAWMAPEQAGAAPAAPTMDVYALGALAFFAITGRPPRPDPADLLRLDLAPLAEARVPRGLAALVRRCLAADAAARYPDGDAVAEDLRRWFADGVTLAQDATRWELAWLRLRRSPRARTAALVAALAVIAGGGAWWLAAGQARRDAEARLSRIATATAIDQPAAVAAALDEVRAIAGQHPGLAAASALQARLQTAYDLAARHARDEAVRARLEDLLHRTRTLGPWADQVQAWRAAIRDAGLSMDPARIADDARVIAASPLRGTITASLAFLWRAEQERGAEHHAAATAALLAAGGPTPAWQALGRLLGITRFAAHDPVFCACADSAATLTEPGPAASALALFAPEPRLAAAAGAVLAERPGDFWALIASARASLAAGDDHAAEHLALVASGAEPDSLLPVLLLAYVGLQRDDSAALERAVARGLAIDPANRELRALRAVALARTGHAAEAQAVVDGLDAGHLQYHLRHAVGHPMERSVRALVAAGLRIPDAPAGLGPLAP